MKDQAKILILCLIVFTAWVARSQDWGAPPGVNLLIPLEESHESFFGKEIYELTPPALYRHPEFGKKAFNCKLDSVFELIQYRTLNSRLFVKMGSHGRISYTQKVYGKFHYRDRDGWLRTIDARLKPDPSGEKIFRAMDQPVPVIIDLEKDYTELQLLNSAPFRFNSGMSLRIEGPDGRTKSVIRKRNTEIFWFGSNGVINKDYFPSVDRELFADRGNLKSNFILKQKPEGLSAEDVLVFSDSIVLPEGYRLVRNEKYGHETDAGDWDGKLRLLNPDGKAVANIDALTLYDRHGRLLDEQNYPGTYRLQKTDFGYRWQIRIAGAWLCDSNTLYPVKIDPFVYGSDTFQKGTMGFEYDIGCAGNKYCSYNMTVTVPGRSEMTRTWAEFESQSFIGGCSNGSDCEKEELYFQLVQPCRTIGFICNDIDFLAGRCTTQVPFLTDDQMDCLDPRCPPHKVDFELRLSHCSCPSPECDTVCHRMYTGTWIMTVEARTLEGLISAKAPYCKGDTVWLTARASWGVPPYNYLWLHNGDTSKSTFAVPTTDTTFICRIRDSCSMICNGCGLEVYDTIHMVVRDNPGIDLSAGDATCINGNDGSVRAEGKGTAGPYQYMWNTDPPFSGARLDSVKRGIYKVTVTDRFGCDTEDSIEVGYRNLIALSASIDSITCFAVQDGAARAEAVGQAPFRYRWSTGDSSESVSGLGPGSYWVRVEDQAGCRDTFYFTLDSVAPLTVDAGEDKLIVRGESVRLMAVTNAGETVIYAWMPEEDLSDPSLSDPYASPDSTTLYIVSVALPGQPDCRAFDSVWVEVIYKRTLFVPTAFSPNADGINDVFAAKGEAELLDIRVFDRWGNLVYEGRNGWDGRYKGRELPMGSYAFLVRYRKIPGGRVYILKGNVTLLR